MPRPASPSPPSASVACRTVPPAVPPPLDGIPVASHIAQRTSAVARSHTAGPVTGPSGGRRSRDCLAEAEPPVAPARSLHEHPEEGEGKVSVDTATLGVRGESTSWGGTREEGEQTCQSKQRQHECAMERQRVRTEHEQTTQRAKIQSSEEYCSAVLLTETHLVNLSEENLQIENSRQIRALSVHGTRLHKR